MSFVRGKHEPYTYVNPSPVARRLLWHVLGVGKWTHEDMRRYGPLDKPGVIALWSRSGAGQLQLEAGSVPLRPGPYCWLFHVRQVRVFTPHQGRPLILESIRFSGPGVDAWLEELDVARRPEFVLSHPERLREAHLRLFTLVKRKPRDWEWRAHDILHAMLREFLMARQLLSRRHLPREILHILNAIEADPFRDWKMSELASRAGLSESTFRAHFREAMREAPHQYVQRCRLDLARELLSDPDLRIKEIAKRLQFTHEDYFTKFFRKLTGISPTKFRKHLVAATPDPK